MVFLIVGWLETDWLNEMEDLLVRLENCLDNYMELSRIQPKGSLKA